MKLLSRLSRVTNPGRAFIPQIDGLRFVAIMAVVAGHTRDFMMFHHGLPPKGPINFVGGVLAAGRFGVHLFFAISGFILALPFAKQMMCKESRRLNLKDYYLRRITRIEPPYVIHLTFLFLLCVLVYRHLPPSAHYSLSQTPHWLGFASEHILASLFYSNGFVFGDRPFFNLVLWSLEIGVQFYIVAPFLAKVFLISSAWKRRAVIAAGMVLPPFLSHWMGGNAFWSASLAPYIEYFLAGFLLVDFYLSKKTFAAAPRSMKWDLVAPAVVVCVTSLGWSIWYYDHLLPWLILIGCISGFRGRISSWLLSRPVITTVGGMCYTICLYHYQMPSAILRVTRPFETHILWLDFLIQPLMVALIAVPICSLFFAVFERPFMRRDWPVRFWSFVRRKGVTAVVGGLAPQPAEAPMER